MPYESHKSLGKVLGLDLSRTEGAISINLAHFAASFLPQQDQAKFLKFSEVFSAICLTKQQLSERLQSPPDSTLDKLKNTNHALIPNFKRYSVSFFCQ